MCCSPFGQFVNLRAAEEILEIGTSEGRLERNPNDDNCIMHFSLLYAVLSQTKLYLSSHNYVSPCRQLKVSFGKVDNFIY